MKKWTSCMVLACALALACTGCGGDGETAGPYSVEWTEPGASQAQHAHDALAVEWMDEPVMVQAVDAEGIGINMEKMVLAREGGLVFELWDSGVMNAIQNVDGENVIAPQHRGHDIGDNSYGIDAAGTCWMEWPSPPDAQDGNWYLYIQPDGEAPVLLDEGTYDYNRKSLRGNGVVMDYAAGNVIWTKPDGDYFVKLYRAATGETLTLDRFPNTAAQVAIGEKDAVWIKRAADQMLYLMHCDLESGAVTQLEQLEDGADNPVICGRFVVMHKNSGRDLWVYDLAQRAWTLHIGSDLPVFEGGAALDVPFVLDDRRIALTSDTMMAPFQMAVVDLASGKAYPVETEPFAPLCYFPASAKEKTLADVDDAVSRIQPTLDGENQMMFLRLTEEGVQKSVQSCRFLW